MIAFKMISGKEKSPEYCFSRSLSSKGLFLKTQNNVKPLKPERGHITVLLGVQDIIAGVDSPGEANQPSPNPLLRLHSAPLGLHSSLSLWLWPGGRGTGLEDNHTDVRTG